MSKIAIVGCDASGKTVFVSALTDYYKSGQRIGQSCALIPADTITRRYTDKLHHTMRIQHQWPANTVTTNAEGVRKMKWTMMKDGKPLTDIEMLDYGGENFRYAFRDDGTTRNAAVVEVLVNYIAEADFIVITVGLDNMIRKLTPEIYRDLEGGDEAYDLDSEAQWITNGLLKLVKAKLETNPPGVVVALTQADKHRETLNEYGGAKALFSKCWADIDMMYPNLNVVAVASVDKLTAGGFPADDYKTDGVLTVMKEFSRYAFGDCDEVSTRLQGLTNRLSNMTDVRTPNDFHETVTQFESAIRELHDKTAIVQDLYKEDFQRHERFLSRCRLFAEAINDTERRTLETQISADYWNEQLRQFPEMAGTIRGVARYYQRKADQIRAEEQRREQARRRAEEARQRQLQLQEEERRQQARIAEEQRLAALKREEDERARRRRIQEEQERERRRREEEERRELELQRLKAEEEKARIERERVERRDKTKAFMLRASIFLIALLLISAAVYGWYMYENKQRIFIVAQIREEFSKVNDLKSLNIVRDKVAACRVDSLFARHYESLDALNADILRKKEELARIECDMLLAPIRIELTNADKLESLNTVRNKVAALRTNPLFANSVGMLDSLDTEISRKKNEFEDGKRDSLLAPIRMEVTNADTLESLNAVRNKVAALRTNPLFANSAGMLDSLDTEISRKKNEFEDGKRDSLLAPIRMELVNVDTLEFLNAVRDKVAALRTNPLFANSAGMLDSLDTEILRKKNEFEDGKRDSLLAPMRVEFSQANALDSLSVLHDKVITMRANPLFVGHLESLELLLSDIEQKKKTLSGKETETLFAALRDAIADDNLNSCREKIAELKRRGLTSYQKSVVKLCDQFCDRLERAQNGDSESMMWIAHQHAEQKTVVKQDRTKAVSWYEKAANAGNSKAMMTLAVWAENGIGCIKDEQRAIFWYTKAAKAGVGNAMYRLGVFYAQGKMGLKKSNAKAHEMFLNAKKNGCTYTDEKTGVDAWLKATKPQDTTSKQRLYFWGSNTDGDDLDSLLNDLDASSSGR